MLVTTPARDAGINFLSIPGAPDFTRILLSASRDLLIQLPGKILFFYSEWGNPVHLFLFYEEREPPAVLHQDPAALHGRTSAERAGARVTENLFSLKNNTLLTVNILKKNEILFLSV